MYLEGLIKSTILDDILVPIGNKSTTKGYLRAMKGLKEFQLEEVRAGCREEISSKGQYLIEGRILLAYMDSHSGISENDSKELHALMHNSKLTQKQTINVKLAIGNFSMDMFICQVQLQQYALAKKTHRFMRNIVDPLERFLKDKHKIYLIKGGVFHRDLYQNADIISKCSDWSDNQYLDDLRKCCDLMPSFYVPHLKLAMVEYTLNPNSAQNRNRLLRLREKFPNESLILTITIPLLYNKSQLKRAGQDLDEFRRFNPKKIKETWYLEAVLSKWHPSSVKLIKRAIIYQPFVLGPYHLLFLHFQDTTHEYGKALEVLNECLDRIDNTNDFAKAFQMRQHLLSKIVVENYWDKL